MPWPYLFYIVVSAFSAAIALSFGYYIWRRRLPGANYFAPLMLAIGEWGLTSSLEMASVDPALKIFWSQVGYVGIVCVPPLWLLFALYYRQKLGWLSGRNGLVLFVFPAIVVGLAWTNARHGLIWSSVVPLEGQPGGMLIYNHGRVLWLHMAYSYSLMLYGSIQLVLVALYSARLYRRQVVMLLAAGTVPWGLNILYFTAYNPLPGMDLTPITFTLSGMLIAASVFRHQLLELLPVAHDTIFQMMPNGVLVFDAQARLVDANPAGRRLLALPQQPEGQPAYYLLQEAHDLLPYLQGKGQEQDEVVLELPVEAAWLEARIAPLRDRRGQVSGRLLLLQDMTVRKQAEQQLVQANQMKTRLLANVSHDLRTPLGAILGFAEMIEAGVFGPANPEQCRAASEIVDSANQLLVFIDNLLGQAQIESGRLILKNQPFDPRQISAHVRPMVAYLAQKKGLELVFEVDPALPHSLVGDIYWLRQIVLNLVSNALKFTQQGSVQVRLLRQQAGLWAIQVCDTGIGIPDKAQALIFEAFHQVEGANANAHGGSGLGLAIVKQLVDLMGGQVALDSRLGQGSTFTVTLPLIQGE